MRALSVLGSTGSIGRQTLEVAAACGHRVLALTEVQLEGKKRMDTEAFLRGYEVLPGTVLGQEEA